MKTKLIALCIIGNIATTFAIKLPSESFKSPGNFPGDPGDAPIGDGVWILILCVSIYATSLLIKHFKNKYL